MDTATALAIDTPGHPNYRVRLACIMPALQVFYLELLWPLVYARGMVTADLASGPMPETESFLLNRLFFPLIAGLSLILLAAERGRYSASPRLPGTFLLASIFGWLAIGVNWSLDPSTSVSKLSLLAMQTIGLLPAVLMARRVEDILRPILLVMGLTLAVNLLAVLALPPTPIGHAGIYAHKNTLGEAAALGGLFALYALTCRQRAIRLAGLLMLLTTLFLLYMSRSKTALLLFATCPFLALGAVFCVRVLRIAMPVLIVLVMLPASFVLSGGLDDFSYRDISAIITGDGTFTGRTDVWDFALAAIAERPWLGYGYQAFWGTGDSGILSMMPEGFVARTPHAHNGYLDLALQGGMVLLGLFCLIILIVSAWVGRVTKIDAGLGFFFTTLLLYMLIVNLLETSWLQGLSLLSLLGTLCILLASVSRTSR